MTDLATSDSPPAGAPRPTLRQVLAAFGWIGVASFGGGRFAYFHEALVVRRRWLTEGEFLEAVALSQIFPGPNVANLAACLGQRLAGWRGAALAVACLTVPGGLMILALGWLYFRGAPAGIIGPIGRGVSAGALGIAVASVLRLRAAARDRPGLAVTALVFVLFGPLHWPLHWVLVACLPVSLVLAWRRVR